MSNSTEGHTRSKTTRAKAAAPSAQTASTAPSQSEAISNVAWVADEQTREAMVRLAAYSFYERRGYVSGSELEDWLQAEMEVDRQLAATQPPGHGPEGAPEHLHTIAPVQTRARLHDEPALKPAPAAPVKARPKKTVAEAAPTPQPPALEEPAPAAPKKARAPKRDAAAAKPRTTDKA